VPDDSTPDQQALARALRKQNQIGQIGILSGDPANAALGTSIVGQTNNQVKELQATRQRDSDTAQSQANEAAARAHQDAVLKQTIAAQHDANALGYAKLDAMLEAAGMKGGKSEAAVQDKNERFLDTQAQQYSQRLAKDGIPQLQTAMQSYEDAIKPYVDANKSIPGVGGVDNNPLVAKLHGITDSNAPVIYGKRAAVVNQMLHTRFGARITQAELNRMAEELGGSVLNSQGTDVSLYNNLKTQVNAHAKDLAAGIHPAAIALYKKRNGIATSSDEDAALDRAVNGNSLLASEVPNGASNYGVKPTGGLPKSSGRAAASQAAAKNAIVDFADLGN
jgi:hypothetical protein